MFNKMLNLAMKFSGASFIWKAIDGKKTYIMASVAVLSGLGGLIGGFMAVEQAHDFAALLAYLKGIPDNQSWVMLVGGLTALGVGHKIDKKDSENGPKA